MKNNMYFSRRKKSSYQRERQKDKQWTQQRKPKIEQHQAQGAPGEYACPAPLVVPIRLLKSDDKLWKWKNNCDHDKWNIIAWSETEFRHSCKNFFLMVYLRYS